MVRKNLLYKAYYRRPNTRLVISFTAYTSSAASPCITSLQNTRKTWYTIRAPEIGWHIRLYWR